MSEEAKMWIGFAVFMGLPIGIMVLAWATDRLGCYVNRPTDRPSTDRPRPLDRPIIDRPTDRWPATDRANVKPVLNSTSLT